MILAAGLGTRLGEITQTVPKALVDVAGTTALERVARNLIAAGADRLIINVHHHADRVIEFVNSRGGFGVDVTFSHERDAALETGGGLLHARPLFRSDAPFLLHNVDVLCDADLRGLYAAHVDSDAVATLAVHERESSRRLLFQDGLLTGRQAAAGGGEATSDSIAANGGETPRAANGGDASSESRPRARAVAFAGIHVISPGIFDLITERGAFSIMDVYLRLAAAGQPIRAHDITGAQWLEIGNPQRLEAARRRLRDQV